MMKCIKHRVVNIDKCLISKPSSNHFYSSLRGVQIPVSILYHRYVFILHSSRCRLMLDYNCLRNPCNYQRDRRRIGQRKKTPRKTVNGEVVDEEKINGELAQHLLGEQLPLLIFISTETTYRGDTVPLILNHNMWWTLYIVFIVSSSAALRHQTSHSHPIHYK